MARFQENDKVVLRGTVRRMHGCDALVQYGEQLHESMWLRESSLEFEVVPAPVTVRCNMGCEHPLTDFKTARARIHALGLRKMHEDNLGDFLVFCTALEIKGVTAEQFREGLTDAL